MSDTYNQRRLIPKLNFQTSKEKILFSHFKEYDPKPDREWQLGFICALADLEVITFDEWDQFTNRVNREARK